MDGWMDGADLEMHRLRPKRYAAPRMPDPPDPLPNPDLERRQLPRNVHLGRVPHENVRMADEWIRSVRWLVALRALGVDEGRCSLGIDRRSQVGPERRPLHH